MQTKTDIHIGKLIYSYLKQHGQSVSFLARELGCKREQCYRIFAKKSIDTDLLLRISKILRHNFFDYYTTYVSVTF